jgi:two-component system sensor histidine kinase KdpD
MIEQVLQNLLENCLRHTPSGTAIEISAWRTEKAVVVKVADRGPGLRPGTELRVFERFYRGTNAPGAGGMGLGLTICRGIIAAHDGRIWAENEPRGGAAFFFSLPLPESAPNAPREAIERTDPEESREHDTASTRASSASGDSAR